MKIPNHCSATVKKQKQLQGITGNGAQGWNHYCQHFNSQHKRTGRKGKKRWQHLWNAIERKNTASSSGKHKAVNYWKPSEFSGKQLLCSFTLCYPSVMEIQYWQKEPWPDLEGFVISSLSSFFHSWSLKNCIATPNEGKDSNDTLGDPSQHPLKPGEGTHRKWI